MPFAVLAFAVGLRGFVLTGFAYDLARISVQAYGIDVQTMVGKPVIWTALNIPQLQFAVLVAPFILFALLMKRWLADAAFIAYISTIAFLVVAWTIAAAYFAYQPGFPG